MFAVDFFDEEDCNTNTVNTVYFNTEKEAKKAKDYIDRNLNFSAYYYLVQPKSFDDFKKYFKKYE